MLNLILLGPPGSGKGTQASLIAKHFGIPSISTGDALRNEIKIESEVGRLAKSYIESGALVPDDVVLNIVKNRLLQKDCKDGFILDGFPRNLSQGVSLDIILKDLQTRISLVLNFAVEDSVVIKRISGRFFCKNCGEIYNSYYKQTVVKNVCDECNSCDFGSREDDKEEIVKSRLKIYHDTSFGLADYYQRNNLIYSANALKNSALLFEELLEVIKNIN